MGNPVTYQTIQLHLEAPAKPAFGAACNGCGVCCASEPCPIGVLVTRRLRGRCAALLWSDDASRYVCGLVAEPRQFSGLRSGFVNQMVKTAAARLIASGIGCDASDEVIDQRRVSTPRPAEAADSEPRFPG